MSFAGYIPRGEDVIRDLRFAFQSYRRRPGVFLFTILSLGIGIGLNATVFTWIQAIYFNPLPGVKNARELVTINAAYRDASGMSNSYADWLYLRDHNQVFAGLFAHETETLPLSDGRSAEMAEGGVVSSNYFQVLSVRMAAGRAFDPDEDQVVDRNPVLVLSYGLWQRRFGGDSAMVGRQLDLNRVPFTVIGIAPRGFAGVYGGIRQDFWVPIHMTRALDVQHRDHLARGSWLQIMGRPKPGVSNSAIQNELELLSARIRGSYRKSQPDYRAEMFPLHRAQRGYHSSVFEIVRMVAIAVALVLLLVCLNVGNLLLARATDRSREITVRMALGASRRRVLHQLLTESLALAGIGGATGLLIACWSQSLPGLLLGGRTELVLNIGLHWQTIAFLFAVSFIAAIAFGLVPALETLRVDLVEALKTGAGSVTPCRRRNLWRSSLVVVQVALSMISLVGTSLLSAYMFKITHAERGFQTQNVFTAQVGLFGSGVKPPRARLFHRAIIDDLQRLPYVVSAGWTTFLPMSGSGGGVRRSLELPGYAVPEGKPQSVIVDSISPGYLQSLAVPLVEGRGFEWSDDAHALQVAMVNEKFVEVYLKGRNPIGTPVRIGMDWRTIIGVHRNYVYRHPDAPHRPTVFLPLAQNSSPAPIIVVRTTARPSLVAEPFRQLIHKFDPNIPVARVMTMEQNVSDQFVETKIAARILAFLSLAAILLSAMGLYSVLATFVSQRRREFGIRHAIGASPLDLQRMILRQGLRLAITGAAFGLLFAAVVAVLLQWVFSGLNRFQPLAYGVAAVGTTLTAVVSAWLPSRRAARVDPAVALRQE